MGIDHNDPREGLKKWNDEMQTLDEVCTNLGNKRCLRVHYEQLVLHPRKWMEIVLRFLGIPWEESVMRHHLQINKPGGVRVSAAERSSDQIIKPVNLEALTEWVGTFSTDIVKDMHEIAPMLEHLGYSPSENPPNYGTPDKEVLENTKKILENKDFWTKKQKQMVKAMEKPENINVISE